MTKPESALIAIVPEAEPVAGPFRQHFDPSAILGVPAHITVLYPFRAPDALDEQTHETLARCFEEFAPIEFELRDIRGFGSETLYLSPDPAEPFRQLTLAVWRLFPANPPYGGQWPEIVPHLSVAHSLPPGVLDGVAKELAANLAKHPAIKARLSEVTLIENTTGRWKPRERFALGR